MYSVNLNSCICQSRGDFTSHSNANEYRILWQCAHTFAQSIKVEDVIVLELSIL